MPVKSIAILNCTHRMDKGKRGFLKATDWGDPEFLKVRRSS